MILFTCRLMPADLRLQSNRETQKSEIYFTNHTLTGKPNAFPFQESESGLGTRVGLLVRLFFAGCVPYLFHQLHFDWEKDAFPSPVWTLPGDSAGRAVRNGFVRSVLANFISPVTL
jgi:hypothetical protein